MLAQFLTDQRFFGSVEEAFNRRKPKESGSALNMRIVESPKADFFGAWKVPSSRPFSRFFQTEDSLGSARQWLGRIVSSRAHNKKIRGVGRCLKHLTVFSSGANDRCRI